MGNKSKRKNKIHLPFAVDLIPPKRIKFRNFEDAALLKIQIKKAVRNLYQKSSSFREISKAALRDKKEDIYTRAAFIGEILQTMIDQGGAVPPYFMPTFVRHKFEIKPDGSYIPTIFFTVFRPEREIAEDGNIYFFGNEIKHEDILKQIWFTGHSLDRVEERLKLDKQDTGFWLSLFNWSTWTVEQIGEEGLILRVVHKVVKKPIPLYFPFRITPTRLIVKTLLIPGMVGIPAITDWEESLQYLRKFWRESVAMSGINLDKEAIAEPDLEPVKPIRI